jgi:hypothetical protein
MRRSGASGLLDRARRGWFAETLVVLGIIAFAFFAMTLQGQDTTGPILVIPGLLEIG